MAKGILISNKPYGAFNTRIEIKFTKKDKVFVANVLGRECWAESLVALELQILNLLKVSADVKWVHLTEVEVCADSFGRGRMWGLDIESFYAAQYNAEWVEAKELFFERDTFGLADALRHSTTCRRFPKEITGPECFPFHNGSKHYILYNKDVCAALEKIEEGHYELKEKLNAMLTDNGNYKKLAENYSRALTEGNAPDEIALNEEIKNEN